MLPADSSVEHPGKKKKIINHNLSPMPAFRCPALSGSQVGSQGRNPSWGNQSLRDSRKQSVYLIVQSLGILHSAIAQAQDSQPQSPTPSQPRQPSSCWKRGVRKVCCDFRRGGGTRGQPCPLKTPNELGLRMARAYPVQALRAFHTSMYFTLQTAPCCAKCIPRTLY